MALTKTMDERQMKRKNIHFDDDVREMTIAMFLSGKSEYEIERAIERHRRKDWNSGKRRRRRAPETSSVPRQAS